MRVATKSGALLAAVLCVLPLGEARAQLAPEPISGRFSDEIVGPNLVVDKNGGKQATNVLTVVYENTTSAALFGVSSTDLAAQWGDELLTTATGLLSTHKFTLFNSGSSAGPLLTATVGMSFYDAVTAAFLGGYSTSINFGAGLPVGFFSIVTVTGLDPLLILLNSTDLIVIQTVISKTGAANRLGIASMGPITTGGSPSYMYISASTIGGGVPGFYNFGAGPADPGYHLALNPPPVGTASKSWGMLKKLYR